MPLRVLHCHSTFATGGDASRAVQLMNAFGAAARHTVLSSVPGALGAHAAIHKGIDVDFPDEAPSLTGRPSVVRYREFAEYMRRFDLILTYNWGAMDAVTARRIFAKSLPPLVHHEGRCNAEESGGLKPERTMMRRLVLPAAYAVVVPSVRIEKIALERWKQPAARVRRISNGIPVSAYGKPPKSNAIPGLRRQGKEVVIGTVAGLRPIKNIPRLVRAALSIPMTRLVVVGDGPDRALISATAAAMGASDRLVMPGFLPDPRKYIGLFDVFALSSDGEQSPTALVEAMATGLPVVTTQVGDVSIILPPDQRPFVTARDDYALAGALRQLVADRVLRARLGASNRALAMSAYDQGAMIAAYARLYNEALGNGVHFASGTL